MRVLIAGLGSIAKKHIAALRRIDRAVELYALRSGKAAEAYEDVVNIYGIEEAINLNFDFVIISSPTFLHKRHIADLAVLGKPLFIEKPLSEGLEIESEVERVRALGMQTYVGCNLRFLHALQFLKNYLADHSPRINEVNVYCGSYLPDWRPEIDFRKSYSANEAMGGGVHLDLVHEIDYVYWLFGAPLTVRSFKSSSSTLAIDSVDYANYLLIYSGFSANIILNYFRREPKRQIELVLDESTLTVDILKNTVAKDSVVVFESEQKIPDTYYEQLSYFIDHLKSGDKCFNDVDEAFEILKICLA